METQQWTRQGSRPKPYTISLRGDGRLSCDCPGWLNKRNGQARSCKHTKEIAATFPHVDRRDDGEYVGGEAAAAPANRRSAPEPVGPAPKYRPLMLADEDKALEWSRFSAAEWAMEQKFDGERCLAAVRSGIVTAWSRAGGGRDLGLPRDLAPHLLASLANLPDGDYDGEIVVKGVGVKSSDVRALVNVKQTVLVIFDLLSIGGLDATAQTYDQRRAALNVAVPIDPTGAVILSGSGEPDRALYAAIVAHGGEGVILKRRASAYVGRRSPDWLKVKTRSEAIGVVTGFEASKVNGSPNAVVLFTLPSGIECRAKTPTVEFGKRIAAGLVRIGTRIEVEYQSLMASGKPRHAMVKRVVGDA